MGCGGSKIDDLPLVTLCRERRDLIKATSDHRYEFAAAHVTYFHSLKDVGDVIRKFVDEELVIGGGSGAASTSSPPGSPVLTLPSENKKKGIVNSSSDTSISHSIDDSKKGIEDSHLNLSSGSDSDSDLDRSGHIHIEDSPVKQHQEEEEEEHSYRQGGFGYPQGGFGYPQGDWGYPGPGSNMYYMKRSSTPSKSVVYEEPGSQTYGSDSGYGYSGYPPPNGGFFGFSMGSPSGGYRQQQQQSPPDAPTPAPPSPRVSTWDYLNVFDSYDSYNGGGGGGYPGYYSHSRYGYGSTNSSPDSKEVREREGIPDLEDETESELSKDVYKDNKKKNKMTEENNKNSGEGTSKAVPFQNNNNHTSEGPSIPSRNSESLESVKGKDISSDIKSGSPDTIVSRNSEEEYAKKKGVSFEVEESSTFDIESSKLSSLTTLSVHGTRDLREVVKEIRDEFETASSYGKEVAVLLEVGKLPYQRRGPVLKVILSRILYLIAPSLLSSQHPRKPSIRLSSRTIKLAKAYSGEPGKDFNVMPGNLSLTLEKLYAWEKKLYKEVKDEERLRVTYEKKCKKLRALDNRGAESSKIDATQASIRKLLTKINICLRAVDAISSRIHKLRDEELQPQLNELIHGLIRMWKSMLKCHQKQFQAIVESKVRSLKANTGFRRDSGLKATLELEMELRNWSNRFNTWINTQKCYVESLNEWLLRCLHNEPEETADGVAPFSPGRIGAPPIFVICNDWYQAMVGISEKGVASAMHEFASCLHQLWERQDEEQRQRIKAEYVSKDFEKQLRTLRMERGRIEDEQDGASQKSAVSKVPSESGVSPLDDLKVDLDSMRTRLEEERARHKEAIKLVHSAASSSLQGGLIPIFKALGHFTSEVLKAHEQVRLENARGL